VTQPPDDLHRRQRLSILAAVEAALADPGRLITILTESEDDDDALRRVRTTFDLDDDVQAEAVLDLQVRRMTRANRVRIAEELRILRGDWGPSIEAHARFSGRRTAVLSIDGADHRIRATGAQDALDRIDALVVEHFAIPQLRPVVVTVSGLPGGPTRMTCTPARNAAFEYPDDPEQPR
jgi:hypothetical protein